MEKIGSVQDWHWVCKKILAALPPARSGPTRRTLPAAFARTGPALDVPMEKPVNVLLVDDNDDDAFFMERAFKAAEIPVNFFRCIDGQEAIHYLQNHPPFTKASFHPRPDFILLDLKLPVKDGFDVLEWIRGHKEHRNLIVALLTSSAQKRDIERAYALNANVYLTKPRSPKDMETLARAIQLCWFQNCARLMP